MWGEVVCLVLGVFLVLGAIFGTRFFAGLSTGIKVPIPVSQGRSWLLIFGFWLRAIRRHHRRVSRISLPFGSQGQNRSCRTTVGSGRSVLGLGADWRRDVENA